MITTMRIRFAPRLVPTLAAVVMIALTVWLGRWQTHRAEEKEARQAMFDARLREAPVALGADSGPAEALLYRRVRASGEWIAAGQVFIDNQVHQGRAGFNVITPLRLAGSDRAVLVNRGWTARTPAYPAAPEVRVPAGPVTLEGIATLPPVRFLELSSETVAGNVWQNLTLARYAERMHQRVLPVLVLADTAGEGLAPVRERPDFGIERHREYALTWFSLAATLAVLWIVFTFRRER
jgi:surfeit locus 1 family protein